MPYSSNVFDDYITKLVDLLRPREVLDIGPGAGKYADLVHELYEGIPETNDPESWHPMITAVEIDESYVNKFKLYEKYDTIIVDDAINLIKTPRIRYDLVIIGDCIEHMRKSDAIDLLNFLVYRSGYICVVYPEAYVQDDWEGHEAEAHISTWSEHDFKGWDTVHREWEKMHMYLIKGYQPSRMTITS